MDLTTVSSEEPLYRLPKVPAGISATTGCSPRRIERKFFRRSSQRNHVWYVLSGFWRSLYRRREESLSADG